MVRAIMVLVTMVLVITTAAGAITFPVQVPRQMRRPTIATLIPATAILVVPVVVIPLAQTILLVRAVLTTMVLEIDLETIALETIALETMVLEIIVLEIVLETVLKIIALEIALETIVLETIALETIVLETIVLKVALEVDLEITVPVVAAIVTPAAIAAITTPAAVDAIAATTILLTEILTIPLNDPMIVQGIAILTATLAVAVIQIENPLVTAIAEIVMTTGRAARVGVRLVLDTLRMAIHQVIRRVGSPEMHLLEMPILENGLEAIAVILVAVIPVAVISIAVAIPNHGTATLTRAILTHAMMRT
jgi:hypothetical protein